jgi:AcrR family transcriptional regulator
MFIFILTAGTRDGIVLNVFNSATTKGKTSKAQLLNISLDLFRQDGFDNTTMRDIAKAANMSLGAFYYYYPSKDSIVLDFYRQVQDEHVAMVAAGMGKKATLRERLGLPSWTYCPAAGT